MKTLCVLLLLAGVQDRRAKKPFIPTSEFETRQLEGWSVRVEKKLLDGPAYQLLQDELKEVARLVPAKAVESLRKIPIWLCEAEGTGAGAEYHPDKGWLEKNG